MILVDALYINKGGGAVLLQYLIEEILAHPQCAKFFFLLDPRFERPAPLKADQYEVIPNKQSERYRFYRRRKKEIDRVFCFANTPPPIRIKGTVYTYFHNQKLLEAPRKKFDRRFFKLYAKYLIVRLFNRNTDYYMVQTPHMVDEMRAIGLKDAAHCLSYPFYDSRKYTLAGRPAFNDRPAEFVFISNPSPQKNYPTLLEAWAYLLENGLRPVLHVTVDNTAPAVTARMNELIALGAQIRNHVYIDPRELYFGCRYLIFPSVMESFGLPLIEATESGMKVLASDLPYVYDVIQPSLTFDEMNKVSIADAVQKALATDLPFPQIRTRNRVADLINLLADGL
jgi:glycosyltransferase involved in cell wall biosynthesis